MTTHQPSVRLGLRHRDRRRPVIRMSLSGTVEAEPLAVDHLSHVAEWNGSTNFRFGTCGPCSCANSVIMTWQYLLGRNVAVADDAIFDLYRRSGNPNFDPVTGADDNGVDMTVMLAALVKGGIAVQMTPGDPQSVEIVKPICFAELDASLDDVKRCTAIAGGVSQAWTLDVAQQSQSDTWRYVSGSAVWGGHATFGGAYTGQTGNSADAKLVSWQRVYGTTDGFVGHQLDGAFIVVWEPLWDHPAFEDAADQASLAAQFEALTGRAFPKPVPAPPPLGDDDDVFDAVIGPWSDGFRSRPDLVRVAEAAKAWRSAKGLP